MNFLNAVSLKGYQFSKMRINLAPMAMAVTLLTLSAVSLPAEGEPASKSGSEQNPAVSAPKGDSAHERAAKKDKSKGCTAELVVKARPEDVFNTIMSLKHDDDGSVREVSKEGNHCILEEKFDGLPIIGASTVVYKETYTPYKTIEYHMVSSDKFQAFEGKWVLSPLEDGCTKVSLSSYVVCDIPVPFARQLTKIHTMIGVRQRLHEVKHHCEKRSLSLKEAKVH